MGLALAATASLVLTTGAQATVLVFDDFESYGPSSILSFTGFTSGLTVTDGSVDYVHEPEYGLATPYGDGMVDLDGSTQNGGLLRTQSLAFAAGQTITLDFDASGNQRGYDADRWRFGFDLPTAPTISFSFASPTGSGAAGPLGSIIYFYRPETTNSNAAWGHYTIGFVAQQAGTFSAFIGTTTSTDNVGPLIDNVRVSVGPVPEPMTWSLMIAGFGLAGAALRRRRAALA